MNITKKFLNYNDNELIKNEEFCRFLNEYNISKEKYSKIKLLIKQTSNDLKSSNPPTGINLEEAICSICNIAEQNFPFAEKIVKYFYDIGYCKDVFLKLYDYLPKYNTKEFN